MLGYVKFGGFMRYLRWREFMVGIFFKMENLGERRDCGLDLVRLGIDMIRFGVSRLFKWESLGGCRIYEFGV